MLTVHVILAAAAAVVLARAPTAAGGAVAIAAAAAAAVALGAPLGPALGTLAPLVAFLTAAFALARIAAASGLAARLAGVLAARARGSALRLYVLACALCALLTAAVSLDGAVVLMVPLLALAARRTGAPFAPLFTGSVVVANAASVAVPQGNPTNLVLIDRAAIAPAAFAAHMLVPGLAAATAGAAIVAVRERRALATAIAAPAACAEAWSAAERHALAALAAAVVATQAALVAGVAPWWPFAAVAAVAVLTCRPRPGLIVPWRVALQVGGLLVLVNGLGASAAADGRGLGEMLGVAVALGASCALANNLPVGTAAAALVGGAPSAYAAAIGLAVGALATPQGSVATLVALDAAGADAPVLGVRELLAPALAGVVSATALAWLLL